MAGDADLPSSSPDLAPAQYICVIVMGVCGCGKSTFGRKLAGAFGCDFIDADDYHSAANIGIIVKHIAEGRRLVVGCSALKEGYRDILRGQHTDSVVFVLLQPSRQELLNRLQARRKLGGHFMPASLLDSQLAILEPQGENLIALQGDGDAEELLGSLLSAGRLAALHNA